MTYAIFATGGAQFRAEPGVTIKIPLLEAEPGSKVTCDRILLASDGKQVHAGKPVVKGAKVTAEVVRHGKGAKIKIYRFARRTGYRRHAGQFVTAGTILVRQRGTKFHPGTNVRRAHDDSLFTVVDGQVRFEHKNKKRFRVSVHPVAAKN